MDVETISYISERAAPSGAILRNMCSADKGWLNFNCDNCAEQVSLTQLGWRHTAGFARLFMDIYSIYPQEGIPTDPFLSLLEKETGVQWDYFFTDQ